MQAFRASDRLIQQFEKLIVECGVLLPAEEVTAELGVSWPGASEDDFLDLDKLWHQYKCFAEATKILSHIAEEIDKQANFDTIIPIVSAVASFGPTPIAAVLAHELKKKLVVLDEVEFGEMAAYPLTLPHKTLLEERRILLIKDVLVHATSVAWAAQLIRKHGGQVAALLVFLDRKPRQRRYDFRDLPDDALYAALLQSGHGVQTDSEVCDGTPS